MLSRKAKIIASLVFVLGMGLAALRLSLPTLIKKKANETLNKIPDYHGHIEAVGMHLWRGAYSIEGLTLQKTDGDLPVPFVSVKDIHLSGYGMVSAETGISDHSLNVDLMGPMRGRLVVCDYGVSGSKRCPLQGMTG